MSVKGGDLYVVPYDSFLLLYSFDIYYLFAAFYLVFANYKDRKYAMNKNSFLWIIASVHYNARDTIL